MSVQAAIRATFDCTAITDMVLRTTERELGLLNHELDELAT
jgi:hypothetical protein